MPDMAVFPNNGVSVAVAMPVASNYYAQPLLDTIARNFSLSASSAGFIVTAAQLGYAAGLLFLVPLGDMFERRRLIVSMTLLAAPAWRDGISYAPG